MKMQCYVTRDGVEVVVFSDRTSAWHKFGTDSTIVRTSAVGDVPPTPKEKRRATRLFQLQRDVDESGVSGVGVVAQGACFSDEVCAMRWLTATASTAVYESPDVLIAIHGHNGATRMVFQGDKSYVDA